MKFELTDEQKLLQDSVRRYAERDYTFEERRKRVKAGQALDRKVWKTFGEMGWLSILLPEDLGGSGQSVIEAALIAEEIGRGQILEPYAVCGILPLLLLAKNPQGRSELIEKVASGEAVVAVAASEPQARGNLFDINVCARRAGSGWRISGHKSLVIGGPAADWLIVSARTSGERASDHGVSLFLVRADTPGVRREGDRLTDWSSSGDVFLDDVEVAADALLGKEGTASSALQDAVDDTIIVLCAEAVGAMQGAIEITSEYIKTRKQFGVPIGSFQALQHRMSDMAIELVQARSAVNWALQSAQLDSPSKTYDVSGCKAMVARIGKWATSQGIQLHGGYGMTEEYRVGQYFKRLLAIDAMFGRVDYHINRYASAMVSQGANAGSRHV